MCCSRFSLLAAFLLCALPLARAKRADGDAGPIAQGKSRVVSGYVLNNNDWGRAKSPKGWQLIDVVKAGKRISWDVRYNWPVGTDPYAVKCYPSVVTGWQWGLTSPDGRLPRTVSTLRRVVSGASVVVHNPGVQNVAYDLWFHRPGKIADQKIPSDELMVWTNRFGGAGPLGKLVGTVRIDGAEYELSVGDIGWKVFSFVRVSNAASWNLDLKAFIDHLVAAGLLPSDQQLTGIQFGTEVFRSPGDARLDVKDYYVEIE